MPQAPPLDALFLDIHMPEASAFEALRAIPDPPPVVFVTAYAEYALEAFEHDAVDYVLKPVSAKRLGRALERLRRRMVPRRTGAELLALLTPSLRFPVKAGGGHVFMDLRKTTHFEVEDEIVYAHGGGERLRTTWSSLAEVEQAFPKARLVRIQRHLLIWAEAVTGLRNALSGKGLVRLSDGTELEVSRRSKQGLKAVLGL
jgi:DNA-binding LytR/AlgR family response regulator